MYNTFNGYMQGAQPYGNPYADRLAAMQQNQAMQQRCDVVTVNGENGAQAYPMAPNSSALLLDESQPLVWLVKTDGAGYKTVSAFNITPYEQAYADLHELGEVAAACEVKKLVESVDCELERVERQRITLECLDYDLAAICSEQDRLLTRYSPNYGVVTV